MKFLKNEILQNLFIYFFLGLIFSLSFEPFSFPYMQVISLSILGYIWIKNENNFFLSFLFGFIYSFSSNIITFSWIVNPFKVRPLDRENPPITM